MLTALLLLATSASAVQTVFPWYPNTFPGAVYFDSTTYVPEIQWADGSTSTTAVQGGVQNIYISTIPGPTGATGPQGPQGATGGIQYVSASTSSVGWFVDSLACNGTRTNYALTYAPSSAMGIFCYLNGSKLTQGTDYTYSFPYSITLSTPAASACADLECDYTINTSTNFGVAFSSAGFAVTCTSAVYASNAAGVAGGTTGSITTWTGATTFGSLTSPTQCSLPNVSVGISATGAAQCSEPSNVTGSAGTAAALAAAGTICGTGKLAVGVDASGNALCAAVDSTSAGVAYSTNAYQSGAAYTEFLTKGSTGTCTAGTYLSASAAGAITCGTPAGTYSLPATVMQTNAAQTMTSSLTVTAANGILTTSSVTASEFFGSGAGLTNISTTTYVLPSDVAKTDVSNTFTSSQTFSNSSFSVGGSKLVVTSGNVGIGTTSPAHLLHVYASSNAAAGEGLDIQNDEANPGIRLMTADTSPTTIRNWGFTTNWNTWGDFELFVSTANGVDPISSTSSGKSIVTVLSNGNVGIGATNPGQALAVTGTIRQSTAQSCSLGVVTNASGDFSGCVASDRALKQNINPLVYSSTTIDNLQPVYYDWIDTTTYNADDHIGFIAQDVQAVVPQAAVSAGFGGLLGVDPNALIAVLVSEVQALRKRVAILEGK